MLCYFVLGTVQAKNVRCENTKEMKEAKCNSQCMFVELLRYTEGYEHGLTFATIKVSIHFFSYMVITVSKTNYIELYEQIINLKKVMVQSL